MPLIPGTGDLQERLSGCQLKCVRLETKVKRLEAEADRLRDALFWCAAAPAFLPGGEAHDGWVKVVAPLLEADPTWRLNRPRDAVTPPSTPPGASSPAP